MPRLVTGARHRPLLQTSVLLGKPALHPKDLSDSTESCAQVRRMGAVQGSSRKVNRGRDSFRRAAGTSDFSRPGWSRRGPARWQGKRRTTGRGSRELSRGGLSSKSLRQDRVGTRARVAREEPFGPSAQAAQIGQERTGGSGGRGPERWGTSYDASDRGSLAGRRPPGGAWGSPVGWPWDCPTPGRRRRGAIMACG